MKMEMKDRLKSRIGGWSLFVVVTSALWLSGCASTSERDSYSDRPWNSPRGWEHTLPTGMTEGR
jgi:hypothetical protein